MVLKAFNLKKMNPHSLDEWCLWTFTNRPMLASKISDHLCNNFVNEALVIKKAHDEDETNSFVDSSKFFIPKCLQYLGGVYNLKMRFKVVSLKDSLLELDTNEMDEWFENGTHDLPTVIGDEVDHIDCVGSTFALNPFNKKNDVYFVTARHNVAPQYNKATKKVHILESLTISQDRVYEETIFTRGYVPCSLVIENHKRKPLLPHIPDITFIKYSFHHLDSDTIPLGFFQDQYFVPRNFLSCEPPINRTTDEYNCALLSCHGIVREKDFEKLGAVNDLDKEMLRKMMVEGRVCQSMGQTLGTHVEGNIPYIAHNSASTPGCSGGLLTTFENTKTKEKYENLRFFDGVHKGALNSKEEYNLATPFHLVSDLYMEYVYPNIKNTLSRKERRHIESQIIGIADGCCTLL